MNPGIVTGSSTILTSWKDIARYMGKGVRTVQRWEQDFGLPVRRPVGSSKKAVLARPVDLDAWVSLRCASRSETGMPGDGRDGRGKYLSTLSTLSCEIQTSQQLRKANRALLTEVHTQVDELRSLLIAMQPGR